MKSIKTLKKKNEKKQRDRKKRAKNDINTIYLRKKFKDSSRLFSTFKNVVVDVVSSSNSITLSIIDKIINEFVAWIIQFTRVTKNSIVYNELFNVAEILIVRKTILKMIQEKKEFKHMNWWQQFEIEFITDDLLIKKAKKYQKHVKNEIKEADENIEAIIKNVDDEFFFLYIFFLNFILKMLIWWQCCDFANANSSI